MGDCAEKMRRAFHLVDRLAVKESIGFFQSKHPITISARVEPLALLVSYEKVSRYAGLSNSVIKRHFEQAFVVQSLCLLTQSSL